MDIASGLDSRIRAGSALVPASLVALLAVWSLIGPTDPASTVAVKPSAAVAVAAGPGTTAGRVVVHGPDGPATATLDDSAVARAFAAELPLRLTLSDPMGQAKTGRLPSALDIADAPPVTRASAGTLYYWAPTHALAIFYDDLGQTVPPPGLVRLGVVDSGLDAIASAGNRFPVSIEPADSGLTLREP